LALCTGQYLSPPSIPRTEVFCTGCFLSPLLGLPGPFICLCRQGRSTMDASPEGDRWYNEVLQEVPPPLFWCRAQGSLRALIPFIFFSFSFSRASAGWCLHPLPHSMTGRTTSQQSPSFPSRAICHSRPLRLTGHPLPWLVSNCLLIVRFYG
jgi:hypothetical protein